MNQTIIPGVIISSVGRALLGEVSCRLRCVEVAYDDSKMELYCYFDGELQEDDVESMQIVSGMVAGDFPGYLVDEHCIRLDSPERKPHFENRIVVFLRKEFERQLQPGRSSDAQ
jgi:hypothetical protein